VRALILAAVAAATAGAGCLRDHPGALADVGQQDCYACHQADYEGATNPVHVGNNPTTCWECHSTDAWQPALAGGAHPEDKFPIAGGAHAPFACTDCHLPELGSSTNGGNVTCIGCHTGAHDRSLMDEHHAEVPEYQWDDARPAFCRDCHPRGRN
jgi:hypothetical protein